MDLYKNFTAHRYWSILSKYTVISPQWLSLSTKIYGFEILIGSNWWLVPCFHQFHCFFVRYLCYQLEFFQTLYSEERSYQYLQDATSFGLLFDKSGEIFKWKYLKKLEFWQTHNCLIMYAWRHSLICILGSSMLAKVASMENSIPVNFPSQNTQCSYQITRQMRWHLVATDKTHIQ